MTMPLSAQPPAVRRALEEFVRALRSRWGERLVAVRLFGSRVRGSADAESDVDICVVIEDAGWDERRAVIDAAADIGLAHDLILSPTVFDRVTYERWREQARPFVVDVEHEGIAL